MKGVFLISNMLETIIEQLLDSVIFTLHERTKTPNKV